MNPFGPKLVRFDDGTYGVRVLWLFQFYFVDLKLPTVQWQPSDKYFKDCKGTRSQAETALNHRLARVKYEIVE
jgi:hypothetical protein